VIKFRPDTAAFTPDVLRAAAWIAYGGTGTKPEDVLFPVNAAGGDSVKGPLIGQTVQGSYTGPATGAERRAIGAADPEWKAVGLPVPSSVQAPGGGAPTPAPVPTPAPTKKVPWGTIAVVGGVGALVLYLALRED
jgi:hypothetical protein